MLESVKDKLRRDSKKTLRQRDRTWYTGVDVVVEAAVDTFEEYHATTIEDLINWVNAQIDGIGRSSRTDATEGALEAFLKLKSKLEALL